MIFDYKENIDKPTLRKEVIVDLFQIVGLYLLAIVFVFFLNSIIRDVAFLILLVLFWRSSKNYLYFGFFFALINSPAYFFDIFTIEAIYRLPIYNFLPGMSFNIIDLFVIIALIKSFYVNKSNFKFNIVQSLFPFFIVAFIIGFLAALWFGTTVGNFANSIRAFFYITLLISFSRLINNKLDLIRFGYLTIPFLILILFNQLFFVITGDLIISFLDPGYEGFLMLNTISGDIRPEVTGVLLVFYSLLFGFILNRNREIEIFRGLSNIIITLAFLCVIISATRIWITIFFLVFFVHLYFSKKLFKSAVLLPYAGLLIFAFLIALNITDYFIQNIWSRYFSFLQSLFSNQISSYDTMSSRVDYSIPKLLEAIGQSPIIGVGFSDLLLKYYDSDVGGLNTILTFGIFGFIIFCLSYFNVIRKIIFYIKNSPDYLTVTILQAILTGFIGMLLGFLTTWDFFSFLITINVYFISIFLVHAEIAVKYQEINENEDEYLYLPETKLQKI